MTKSQRLEKNKDSILRQINDKGVSLSVIAKRYGVHQSTITRLREKWMGKCNYDLRKGCTMLTRTTQPYVRVTAYQCPRCRFMCGAEVYAALGERCNNCRTIKGYFRKINKDYRGINAPKAKETLRIAHYLMEDIDILRQMREDGQSITQIHKIYDDPDMPVTYAKLRDFMHDFKVTRPYSNLEMRQTNVAKLARLPAALDGESYILHNAHGPTYVMIPIREWLETEEGVAAVNKTIPQNLADRENKSKVQRFRDDKDKILHRINNLDVTNKQVADEYGVNPSLVAALRKEWMGQGWYTKGGNKIDQYRYAIEQLRAEGMTHRALADKFECSQSGITAAFKRWAKEDLDELASCGV